MYIRPAELPPLYSFLRRHGVEVDLLIELLEAYQDKHPASLFDPYETPEKYIDATTYKDKVGDFLEMLSVESVPVKSQ
ncbi:hypothetical protein [Runella slithyformis]|uniref:Uncharacterized protein n=1 Tax=Runella slithyformis (strain ATCC 29530 / DSM 19594 / LMG 11500 / NCIMB 11436 / LSU 4) TaxID=761193 RepID=A0A7U3ZGM3_RUNSL|nr:hypothetical protein [Runella slithyformis]AEI46777.1 hypothetical protein Runsl_0325 [Runella slithyformis DSM 19594]